MASDEDHTMGRGDGEAQPAIRSHYRPRSRAGLATLYITTVIHPHPLTLHGGVWALLANTVTALIVSGRTRPPAPETIERVHGFLEEFVYGGVDP